MLKDHHYSAPNSHRLDPAAVLHVPNKHAERAPFEDAGVGPRGAGRRQHPPLLYATGIGRVAVAPLWGPLRGLQHECPSRHHGLRHCRPGGDHACARLPRLSCRVGDPGSGRGAGLQPQAPAAAAPARLARRLCACGLSDVADVATMPAFPFQPAQPVAASEGERQPPRRSGVLCAVCLEDVRAGEIVRQLPACRHLFHVE